MRIAADDLHVDRSREAEVEDLRHDVGRLEEEGQIRKALEQSRAQLAGVVGGRPVVGLQGDEDLAVGGRHQRCIAEGEVDAAGRQTDVVDHAIDLVGGDRLANDVLDLGETARRFFEACAGGSADVQPQLPGIDGREEVHADQPEEPERQRDEADEDPGDEAPVERATSRAAPCIDHESARSDG